MGDEHKMHLVSWNQICHPLRAGGLGIRNIHKFNKALLRKWLWRYTTESETLWYKIIKDKYEYQPGGWCSKVGLAILTRPMKRTRKNKYLVWAYRLWVLIGKT